MIRITAALAIDEREIEESFIRASGPGGQNVNKVSSAVQLRFDAGRSPSLPEDVRSRLMRLAGSRLTRDGILVINAQAHRAQARNRAGSTRSPGGIDSPRLCCAPSAAGHKTNQGVARAAH